MKKILFAFVTFLITWCASGQNVGIGTNSPTKKLSVNGTIVVDHELANSGTLDSASLLFGANGGVGVTSNKNSSLIGYRGMDIWTNNIKRISISEAGNVGIGIAGPLHKLQVGGEIVATDYVLAGSSLRAGSLPFSNSYKLQVNGGNSLLGGKLYVGGTTASSEQLYVTGTGGYSARFTNGDVVVTDNLITGGNTTVNGSLTANTILSETTARINGNMSIGGALDNSYKLRVYDGNARIGGDFHATGNASIGGVVDNNWRLRVYDGNSRFGGDVQVTGALTAASGNINNLTAGSMVIDNTLTIGGKGSVRSNGPSSLKIHFMQVYVEFEFNGTGQLAVFPVNLPDFDNAADVRLSISHFVPVLPLGDNPHNVTVTFTEFNSTSNSCVMAVRALPGVSFILAGHYYVMAVMKDN